MQVSTNSEAAKNRARNQALSAAVVTTLAAGGVSQAALVVPPFQNNTDVTQLMGTPLSGQETVATGNVFYIGVAGYDISQNISSGAYTVNDAAFLVNPVAVTFGTTKTLTNVTIGDGETVTIRSSETTSKGITTDKITYSAPTRLVGVGTTFTDGDVINEEDLLLGFSAGTGLKFSNPVTTNITASGTLTYYGNHVYTFSVAHNSAPYTQLDSTDTLLSADEGLVNFYTDPATNKSNGVPADFTAYNSSSFSFTFSYATPPVPEPTTGAVALVLGSLGLIRRRRNGGASSVVDLSTGLVDNTGLPGTLPGIMDVPSDAASTSNEMLV